MTECSETPNRTGKHWDMSPETAPASLSHLAMFGCQGRLRSFVLALSAPYSTIELLKSSIFSIGGSALFGLLLALIFKSKPSQE